MTARTRNAVRGAFRAATQEARHDAAPREREGEPPAAARTVITDAMIEEWLANDEELHAWREQEARPRLW